MIRQEKEGKWLAECDICSWKTQETDRISAENRLERHLNIAHRTGGRGLEKQKPRVSSEEKPPELPEPIKEQP